MAGDERQAQLLDAIRRIAVRYAPLELLVLHGSRARGDAVHDADWDLVYLADPTFDRERFLGEVVAAVGTERIDLADLARSSALLRFRAARDGVLLHQGTPGAHEEFIRSAALFWCDAEPIIRRAYAGVLADLG
jgi:predicted nucleotidyltransferase